MTNAIKQAALLLLCCSVIHTARAIDPANCDTDSWIAGLTEICNGELIYRDYVYDDYGAADLEQGASKEGAINATYGTVLYETDISSADLVALRLRVVGRWAM